MDGWRPAGDHVLVPYWAIAPEPVGGDEAHEAIREYYSEIARRVLGRAATEEELRKALGDDPHDDLAPPHGVFLVARAGDGALIGHVGLRALPDMPGTVELKRMYVRPAGRRSGLGRGLLQAAEAAARDLGGRRIVLETNTGLAEARALYVAHGYQETAPYHGDAAAEHWYAKDLTQS